MSSPAKQLGSAEKLPDGTAIRLRLIRPEDEALLQDLAAHMSPEASLLRGDARIEPSARRPPVAHRL